MSIDVNLIKPCSSASIAEFEQLFAVKAATKM